MRGVFRSGPNSLPIFTIPNATRLSGRTEIPGDNYQFECEAFLGQNRNPWRRFPVWARGFFRPEPKFLAVSTSLNASRLSARAEIPGGISQFVCEAFSGQDWESWLYSPVSTRGVTRPELKCLAVFPSLNARRFSARTEIPGNSYQFGCEA